MSYLLSLCAIAQLFAALSSHSNSRSQIQAPQPPEWQLAAVGSPQPLNIMGFELPTLLDLEDEGFAVISAITVDCTPRDGFPQEGPSYRQRYFLAMIIAALACLLSIWLWMPAASAAPLLATTAPQQTSTERSAPRPSERPPLRPTARAADSSSEEVSERSAEPLDIARIVARGKLVVAVLGKDNPPFFAAGQDKVVGLDIDLAQAMADQLGVKLEVNRSAQTFDEVVDSVYQLKADLAISKISRTLKRAKRVRFSTPYLKMRQGLLVNRLLLANQTQGRSPTETIRGLSGKVGVIQGSSYVGFLKQKFPQAVIVEYPTWPEIVAAVGRGDLLAAYRDELEIKRVVLSQPDAALQLQTIALTDTQDSLAIVLPWDSGHLLAFVNQYLDTLTAQYTVDSILTDYAAYAAKKPS